MSFSIQQAAPRVFLWQRANQAIYLARNILLAQFITPAGFGDFAIALNLASYVAILGTLEFRTAFFTVKNLSKEQIRVQWSAEIVLNSVNVLIGLALIPWFETTRSSEVISTVICLLLVNLIEATFSTHLYLLEKDLHFSFLTVMYTLVNLVSFLICLCLAMIGWGLVALVIDRIVAAGIKGLALHFKSGWRPRFLLRKAELHYYWGFVSVLFLTGLLGKVLFGFDIYVIGIWIGSEANGIYSMAIKWALLPMELGGGFLAVMALSFYSRQLNDSIPAFRSSYTEVTFHITRFCLTVAVFMAIFMEDFFRICYDKNWQAVPTVFSALLPYAILRPLYQNVCQALQAKKDLWSIFSVMFLQSIVAIVLIWLIIPKKLPLIALTSGCALGMGYIILELHLYQSVRHPLLFLFTMPFILAILAIITWFSLARGIGFDKFSIRIGLSVVYLTIATLEWWIGRKQILSRSCDT